MAYVFSTGILEYDGDQIGTISSVDLDQSSSLIPLQGNMVAPLAMATGPGKMSGSCKFSAFDPTFLGTITNAVMAPRAADLALIWYFSDTAAGAHSISLPNCAISSLKMSAASDKWLETTMGFEAAATGGTDAVVTVGATAAPAAAITSAWVFSSGELTLQTHVVGTINSVDLDISWATIPLMADRRYPVAVANGAIKVTGSVKFSALDTNFVESISTNAVMAATSGDLAAVWHFHDTAGANHTITLPAVTLGGWKLAAGNDKWIETTVNFEAYAAVADSNIIEVVTA